MCHIFCICHIFCLCHIFCCFFYVIFSVYVNFSTTLPNAMYSMSTSWIALFVFAWLCTYNRYLATLLETAQSDSDRWNTAAHQGVSANTSLLDKSIVLSNYLIIKLFTHTKTCHERWRSCRGICSMSSGFKGVHVVGTSLWNNFRLAAR